MSTLPFFPAKILILLLVAIHAIPFSSFGQGNISSQELIAGLKMRDSLTNSFEIEFSVTWSYPDGRSQQYLQEFTYRYMDDFTFMRKDVRDPSGSHLTEGSFNGRFYATVVHSSRLGVIGFIPAWSNSTKLRPFIRLGIQDLEEAGDRPLGTWFEETGMEVLGKDLIRGHEAYRMSDNGKNELRPPHNIGYDVWIAPGLGFAPVRIDVHRHGFLHRIYEFWDFVQDPVYRELWKPRSATKWTILLENRFKDFDIKHPTGDWIRSDYDISSITYNAEYTPDDFELVIPEGYEVQDYLRGTLYRVGEETSETVMPPRSTAAMVAEWPNPLEIGSQAPVFVAQKLEGGEVRLEDFRGKYVLLDFWAAWCGPCIEETPHLKDLYEAFRDDERFAMIGLSLDQRMEEPRTYTVKNGLGWVQGFLGEWSQTPVPDLYGVSGIPAIFLLDPDGNIMYQGLRGESIMQAVESALESDVSAASTEDGQADAVTLRGVVEDASGRPVVGAVVWAVRVELVPIDRREVTTDSEGVFEFALEEGRWKIQGKLGMSVGKIDQPYGILRLKAGDSRGGLRIVLRPGGRLFGEVRDEQTGKPVPGAQLWIDEGVLIESDGEGRFEYEGLSQRDHKLYAIAPGYARERVLFDNTLRESAGVIVRVPRGGVIRGTVRDTAGDPIANARVWRPGSGHTVALQARVVRSDEQGRFELQGVHFYRSHGVEASATGFEKMHRGELVVTPEVPEVTAQFVLRPAGEAKDVTRTTLGAVFEERPLRDVQGAVRLSDGTPAEGATVSWISNALKADRRRVETGSDGTFELKGIFDIQSMLMVVADKHASAFVPLEAGVRDGIEVALEPEEIIRGRVVGAMGAPVSGVQVVPMVTFVLESICGYKWFRQLSATSDDDGVFMLTRLPKSSVTFDFLRQGMSDVRNRSLEVDGDNVVTMIGSGAIRGKVVDVEGLPVSDYRILVQSTNTPMAGKKSGSMFAGYMGIGIRFSNADGEFVVSGLTADRIHRVVVVAEGYADAVQDPVLSYPVDQLPPAEELVLRVGPPQGLRLRVTDWVTEKPIADARVQLVDFNPEYRFDWGYQDQGWERRLETMTDSSGEGAFPATGMSEGTLLVRAAGYGRQRLPWKGSENSRQISLEREAIVQGVAAAEDGKILAQGVVRLMDQNKNSYTATINPAREGRFAFRELPSGSYSLFISRDNQQLFRKEFELQLGQLYDLDVNSLAVMRLPSTAATIVEQTKPLEIGSEAPVFVAEQIGGGEVRLEDFRGRYVVIDFWATWCGPCIEETPHLKAVYEAFGDDERFAMIGLSLDRRMEEPRAYTAKNGLGWVQGFLGEWSQTPLPNLYGVSGIPAIFLLDPDGNIIHQGLRGEAIMQAVESALE